MKGFHIVIFFPFSSHFKQKDLYLVDAMAVRVLICITFGQPFNSTIWEYVFYIC